MPAKETTKPSRKSKRISPSAPAAEVHAAAANALGEQPAAKRAKHTQATAASRAAGGAEAQGQPAFDVQCAPKRLVLTLGRERGGEGGAGELCGGVEVPMGVAESGSFSYYCGEGLAKVEVEWRVVSEGETERDAAEGRVDGSEPVSPSLVIRV